MKYIFLGIRSVILLYIIYLLIFLLSDQFAPTQPYFHPPFSLIILDWINLFIHEAGHLFFSPFGFMMKLLGGSLMQLLVPLAAIIVWYRRDRLNAHYFLFWFGESMINISVYVGDAPYRQLRLISSGALHDWNTILGRLSMLESAGTIASFLYVSGIIIIIGSIVAGTIAAIYQNRHWKAPPISK
ncbi:MAG: hypothetical protein ABSB78_07885 [Bacteroidota bacterium]